MAATTIQQPAEPANSSPVDGIESIEGTAVPDEGPKLKGRQRLLENLRRISSSTSLSLGRKRASSNPYTGRQRGSTFSLLSPSGNSSFSRLVPGQNANSAPDSGHGTPMATTPSPLVTVQNVTANTTNTTTRPRTATMVELKAGSAIETPVTRPQRSQTVGDDYFSQPMHGDRAVAPLKRSTRFDFWKDLPQELKLLIFSHLKPKELVRASIVSKAFHKACFDGQLWTSFDASEFYTEIPAASLANIIKAAGPFVKDLNLRGCVQVEHYNRADVVVKSCTNLMNATLEGCRNFKKQTLHTLLSTNSRLLHLNLTGLTNVDNRACKIVSRNCPQLETFNVSWCTHMDARGVKMVLAGCPKLRDLRVGEIKGFSSKDSTGMEVAELIFENNILERLVMSGCSDLTDDVFKAMIQGADPEIDILSEQALVPQRNLRHLDLTRCNRITDSALEVLANNVPMLEGLQLSGCTLLTDRSLSKIISTMPFLTHLDLEELAELTNVFLAEHLAKAPCANRLEHLAISYCENLGDVGMLPVMRECTSLQSVDMDNTRISDLVLTEAAAMVRARSVRNNYPFAKPQITLRMVVFDCGNVTWTGVREIMSRNAEIKKMNGPGGTTFQKEVVALKCFYGWQMTVDEHMKRVLRGELGKANVLERKWADSMILSEEANTGGAGRRRRQRRAREAAMLHADEEEGGIGAGGIGHRRRARSNGCAVM